jgi:hypothetical protein
MNSEEYAKLKLEALKIAKEYYPTNFDMMMEKYKVICAEIGI